MSILPRPTYPKPNEAVAGWVQHAYPWQMRRWIVECRSIAELFDFIAAEGKRNDAELNALAQQQIQTLMAAETHEHLRQLMAPPVARDPRTYVSFLSGFIAGALSSILANLVSK